MFNSYKKIIIFIFSSILSIWIGFFCFDIPTDILYYQKSIYWFLTITILFLLDSLIKSLKINKKQEQSDNYLITTTSFFKSHWIAIFLSFLLTLLGFFSCKPDFRILADETNLLSDSQSLYSLKESFIDCSSITTNNGEKTIFSARQNKRPSLFPYLLCIIHSLCGYRYENAFILNFIVGFASLFLIYYIIYLLFGKLWGINSLICLASYPLYLVYVNSSGFDVFNMMCSLVFFICLYRFKGNPNATNTEILILWTLLLSQSRYESVLSFIIAIPTIIYFLPKEEYSKLSYKMLILPFLFIPLAWQRMTTLNASSWQIDSINSGFNVENLVNNLNNALFFFFSNNDDFGTIPLISLLGIIGLIVYALDIKSYYLDKKEKTNNYFFLNAVTVFFILHAIAKFSYKLSDLTDIPASRHGIIFLPWFIIMTIYFLVKLLNIIKLRKSIILFLSLLLLISYWPKATINCCGLKHNDFTVEFKTARTLFEKYFPNKSEFVILSYSGYLYTPLCYNSINFDIYEQNRELIDNYYYTKEISYYVAIQLLDINSMQVYKKYKIPDKLKVIENYDIKVRNNYLLRFTKCVPFHQKP